jgi:hypothetical protein
MAIVYFVATSDTSKGAPRDSYLAIVYCIATSDDIKGCPGDFCITIVYSVATSDASKRTPGDTQSAGQSSVAAAELSVELRYILGSLRSTLIYFFIYRWNVLLRGWPEVFSIKNRSQEVHCYIKSCFVMEWHLAILVILRPRITCNRWRGS